MPTVEGKTPGAGRRRSPLRRAFQGQGTHRKRRDARYRVRRGSTERPRDGPWAVVADQSPEGWEPSSPGREGGEPQSRGTHWREGDAGHHVLLAGPRGETPGSPTVAMKLQRSAEQAQRYPERVFNNGLHVIDGEFLREASRQTRKSRAPGADQVTAKQYAENLEANLQDLHGRVRANR